MDDERTRRLAVVNVGRRPTFHPEADEDLVEAHLLDFAGDLYGRHLELEFVAFLREERRFPGLDALRSAIAADIERARALAR